MAFLKGSSQKLYLRARQPRYGQPVITDFDAIAAKFCEDCAVADEITDPDADGRGVMPHALDMNAAKELWSSLKSGLGDFSSLI